MSAIGAVTSSRLQPQGPIPGPVAASSTITDGATTIDLGRVHESKVAGLYLTGDALTDRVVNTFQHDPLTVGSVEHAADIVSASSTYDPTLGSAQRPVPGATIAVSADNARTHGTAAEVAAMSTSDVIAMSESELAKVARSGTPEAAAAELASASAPGNILDTKLAQLQQRQGELARAAEAAGHAGDPVAQFRLLLDTNKLALDVLLVQREQEKREALRRLLWSLMCGVVPVALIARMKELGMGALVERMVEEFAHGGQHLAKSMVQQLAALGALGIQVHLVDPEFTFDGTNQRDAKLAAQAVQTTDGRLVDPLGRTVGAGNDVAGHAAQATSNGRTAAPRSA
jgi:hypothetical protein